MQERHVDILRNGGARICPATDSAEHFSEERARTCRLLRSKALIRDVKDRDGPVRRGWRRGSASSVLRASLAFNFGILPWEQSDPLNDATQLLKLWLDERGGSTPYEARQAVAQIRHFIEVHGDSRFDDITTPDPDRKPVANRAGFRRESWRRPALAHSCRRSGATKSAPESILE